MLHCTPRVLPPKRPRSRSESPPAPRPTDMLAQLRPQAPPSVPARAPFATAVAQTFAPCDNLFTLNGCLASRPSPQMLRPPPSVRIPPTARAVPIFGTSLQQPLCATQDSNSNFREACLRPHGNHVGIAVRAQVPTLSTVATCRPAPLASPHSLRPLPALLCKVPRSECDGSAMARPSAADADTAETADTAVAHANETSAVV